MLVYLKINWIHQISNECSSKVNKLKPFWTNNTWKKVKYDIKTTDVGAVSHPSFQVHWEPVWHINHFKSLLNFFFKIYFPKVFNFTCLFTKEMYKYWVMSTPQAFSLIFIHTWNDCDLWSLPEHCSPKTSKLKVKYFLKSQTVIYIASNFYSSFISEVVESSQ